MQKKLNSIRKEHFLPIFANLSLIDLDRARKGYWLRVPGGRGFVCDSSAASSDENTYLGVGVRRAEIESALL